MSPPKNMKKSERERISKLSMKVERDERLLDQVQGFVCKSRRGREFER